MYRDVVYSIIYIVYTCRHWNISPLYVYVYDTAPPHSDEWRIGDPFVPTVRGCSMSTKYRIG